MSAILSFIFDLWDTSVDFLNTCAFSITVDGRAYNVSLLSVMLASFVLAIVIRAFIPKP